jgi:hypothetical protein
MLEVIEAIFGECLGKKIWFLKTNWREFMTKKSKILLQNGKKWNVVYCDTLIKHKNVIIFLTKLESLSLLCLAWNCLGNSNFNIHFLFQNLIRCYKWKHDFEDYLIMYKTLL